METKKEDRENVLFTDKMIISFIIPIMLEKFLLRLSEIVDNIMTSQLGEVVISGLSLAGQLNIFVYNIFRGFVLGASILLSHLLGSRKTKLAQDVVYTMISVSILFSILITILFQLFGRNIIALFFGSSDIEIQNAVFDYIRVLTFSYPIQALYFCCTDLSRAIKDSRAPTIISIIMNIINIVLNYIFIFVFNLGIFGAGLGTLIARMISTTILFIMLCNKNQELYLTFDIRKYKIDIQQVKKILNIGIPSMIDKGLFQFGKISIYGLLGRFGAVHLAANAIVMSIASIVEIIPDSISMSMTTVVGYSYGAGNLNKVRKDVTKLLKFSYLFTSGVVIISIICIPILRYLYIVTDEVWNLTVKALVLDYILIAVLYSSSFSVANALRAMNDIKFTTLITIISMWVFRYGGFYILSIYTDLGAIAMILSMGFDWLFRSVVLMYRFYKNKWIKDKKCIA